MREILYGRQPVRETLRAGRRRIYRLLLAETLKARGIVGQIIGLAEQAGVPLQRVERKALDKIGGEVNHQGLAAEVSEYPYSDLPVVLDLASMRDEPPFVLLLDHLQDPQNLGSLLRTAEAAGLHGVLIPGRRAAGVTPAVVRASAGAAEHVHVVQVTNLVRAMEWLKEYGVWLAGLESVPVAQPYTASDLGGSLGLVVGSEGAGLSRLVRESCDFLVQIPMLGQVGSLNAAVAGAAVVFEVRRQRGHKKPRDGCVARP